MVAELSRHRAEDAAADVLEVRVKRLGASRQDTGR
jgi:hypothetical protein